MNKTVAHYVHYSYENFNALVNSGKASWEAVETLSENKKRAKNSVAAVNAEPDLDEYGFPKLQATLFQGQHNDATLSECALAVNAKPIYLNRFDLIPKKLDDGTHGMYNALNVFRYPTKTDSAVRHAPKPRMSQGHRSPCTPRAPKKDTPRKLSFKPRGRPRKVPRTGLPANVDSMTPKEIKNFARLQQAAIKYDVLKIEKEIDRRVSAGENPANALDTVLDEVADEHAKLGLPSSLAAEAVRVRAEMPGDRENKPILPADVVAGIAGEVKINSPRLVKKGGRPNGKMKMHVYEYVPSVIAHSQPVLSQPLLAPTIDLEPTPKRAPRLSSTRCRSMDITYMPSVIAHTQPVLRPSTLARSTTTTQRKQNPTRGAGREKRKASPDFASVTDLLRSQTAPDGLSGNISSARKKRKRGLPTENIESLDFENAPIGDWSLKRKRSEVECHTSNKRGTPEYLPSIAAHSQMPFHVRERLSGSHVRLHTKPRESSRGCSLGDLTQNASQESWANRILNSRTESEMKNYRKHLNEIQRPKDGIFIGSRSVVYRKGGKGPRKSQLAIFKLQRLDKFSWFQTETSSSDGILQSTTSKDCETRTSAHTHYSSALSQLDNDHPGVGAFDAPPARASSGAQMDFTHVPGLGPLFGEKETRRASSVDPHIHPSVDSTSTSTNETSSPTSFQNAQKATPSDPSNRTTSTLLMSFAKKRPHDPEHEDALDKSLRMKNNSASNGIEPLNSITDQLSPSQQARFISSRVSIDGCTPEGALELQEEETRPLEVTRDAPGVHEESRLSINQTPFQDGITRSSSLADDHLANVSLEDTVKDPVETKKRSRAKAIPKLSLTGGSVGLLRKKIVMDIVQNCGGVFPSDRELVYPFAYAWQKEGKPGAPEKPTVTAACKSLYASGKLRQLYFSFKDKKGLMVTKSMMTVPEISPTDPKVKEIQQKIIEFYPRPYIPDKAEVSEDVRNRFSSPQVYGTNRTFPHLEIDHESRVQLQHKPQYVQRIESMRNLRGYVPEQKGTSEPGGMTETSTSTITDLVSNELVVGSKQNLSSHVSASIRGSIRRPDLDPASNPPVRKVERLASIRKPRSGLDTSHKFSQYVSRRQVQPSAEESSRKSHLNLPSEALQAQVRVSDMRSNNTIDPEVNLRGRAADKVNSTGTWRQGNFFSSAFSTEARSPQSGLPFTTGQSLCLAPSEEAWVLPKKRAPYKKRIKPYLPSIAAHTQPYLRPTRRYIFKRYLPSIAAHTQPIYKPVTIKRKHTKQSQPTELSNDLVSRASTKASGIKVKYALKTSGTLSIDPWYAHRQMSTIMDPDHHFHPASGTFSTIFTAPKMRGRRTQTIAKPEAPLADQVYPNWSFSDQPSIDWISDQRAHNKTAFDAEVDKMLHWELETESFAHAAFANPSFINFVFHHPHKLSTNAFIDMDKVVNVSFSTVDDHILYKPFTPSIAPRPEVDRKVLSKETRQAAPVVPAAAAEAATPAKRKQQKEPMEKFMSRRLTSLPGGHGYGRTKPLKEASSRLDADGRPIKIRRIRGPQILQGLGEHGERRLIFATLVIRTLTGGLERHIDWVLVARLFAPKFDQMFVQNRWNAVLNKYRFEYERLYAEFQDMFAQAYEDGLVPPIDYDDLESYDWAWLVDWTMENIEAPSKNVPGLPAERVKFDDRFATRETHENNLHAFYETDVAHALPARTSNILKQSFALPLNLNCASIPAQEPKQFAVAKSWIRANIITPEASYNPDLARAKLLAFNETTIELALKELMGSRILSQQNKGRLVPGRNYNIAQHVLDRLKKSLDVERFLCAAVYKRQLDKNLEKNGAVEFSPTANDGIVLAVMNMQAHGRIEIRPKNPPMNKFGLTDGGYETRKMDKSRLNFSCEIRPRNSYISGNPLLPLPPPPSQHLETPMSKIPLWYDIHDKLVPAVWEIVLVATMAVLALRPGIGAKEIEKSMRPALEAWELNQVLGWMVLAKVAKKVGKGFTVEEWWWLCMETGNREKDSGAEAEGDTNMDTEGN